MRVIKPGDPVYWPMVELATVNPEVKDLKRRVDELTKQVATLRLRLARELSPWWIDDPDFSDWLN